ncbi:MAG TPA: hypothetical protein VMI75_08360 [Polyangiaceae bacterium]|nr:hypothetical protein [Polyangiaceae bacterium]
MAIKVDVDCPKQQITVHFRIKTQGNLDRRHADIRAAVDTRWNQTPPLRYYNCEVHFVVDFFDEQKHSMDKSEPWDTWQRAPQSGRAGLTIWDEAKLGPNSPTIPHTTQISETDGTPLNPDDVAHELGHDLGLNDFAARKWDQSGIQGKHVEEILNHQPFRQELQCCRAVADAHTARQDGEGGEMAPPEEH